jgi:tRNA-dihydrouridine synthase 3
MSPQEYKKILGNSDTIDGVMCGRGALIKPWIFEEIKRGELWDISANERLDMLQKFATYGMAHWGSDNQGIKVTRSYLCEWLSFQHRYVPVGLIETSLLPQKINQRPQAFKGRSELETLMGSPNVNDWIKLTEMTLLGKVPESFTFIPKHKSNSYESNG